MTLPSPESLGDKTPPKDTPNFPNDGFDEEVLKLLYEIDEGFEVENFYIDTTKSEQEAIDQSSAIARINLLCEAFGIRPTAWADSFVTDQTGPDGMKNSMISPRGLRALALTGENIGTYISDRAFWGLPIEMDTDGSSFVALSLSINDDFILRLKAEGNFTTSYFYKDTEDDEEMEENEDNFEGSEMEYEFKYSADVLKKTASRPNQLHDKS